MADESGYLLTSRSDKGDNRKSATPGVERSHSYQSFDNQALELDDEETYITEAMDPLPSPDNTGDAAPNTGTAAGPEYAGPNRTASRDADTVSIVTIDNDGEDANLSGEEILFRLRLANVHGDLDWPKLLRRLHGSSREEVHIQILDTLREQPIDIHQKKRLSGYLRDRLDAASVSSLTSLEAKRRQNRRRRGFSLRIGIWNSNIGKISAYFGSHVASYFVFLRFLVFLDLLLAVLLFCLVTLPQILSDDPVPEGIDGDFGALSSSVMFFGAYNDTKWGFYDRPLAFFLTWSAANVICFLIIVVSMYIKYNISKRADSSEEEFPYSARVFSSWDYTLMKPEGAALRTKAIVTHTKEMVREERSKKTTSFGQTMVSQHIGKPFVLHLIDRALHRRMITDQYLKAYAQFLGAGEILKLNLLLRRLLVNVGVIGVLGGSVYLIVLVADSSVTSLGLPGPLETLLRTYKLPLMVAALKMCVPPLFDQVIRLEKWAPRTKLKLNITRTALFYLASLVVLLLSLYEVSTECIRDSNSTAPVLPIADNRTMCCWENEVGEEVFKVVLIDLGQIILTTLIFDYLRAAFIKCGKLKWLGYSEFSIASEVLDVIYGQSLIWLGLFFSPLLSVFGFVKLIVVFYFHYLTARVCRVPPRKVFRASRSGNFFMFILLLNFFVCLFTMTYAIIQLEPSTDCGPFKKEDHVYEILTSRVGDLPTWLRDALVYVSTPAIVVPVILLLLLAVLYFKAKSSSYDKVISKLRQLLKFERRVQKREVFARARFLQGRQVSSTPVFPHRRASITSKTSLSDAAGTTAT